MTINGQFLKEAFISGAYNIQNNRQLVDELNVFPVPDGDTGTNMSLTIGACVKELEKLDNPTVEQVANTTASALLRGARGNSGVILSLLFRGFSKGLKDKTEMSAKDLANSLSLGVEAAYKAVMKPTEGTILTVARIAGEKATELAEQTDDIKAVFDCILENAIDALNQTPEMLPVLKKAGVVDAGGKGLVVILEGIASVANGNGIVEQTQPKKAETTVITSAVAEYEGEITFTYCTEFIILKDKNCDDPLKLRAYLETIGDSVVVVDDEDIIKSHVHTNDPGKALQKALTFGALTNIKIENMREQHQEKIEQAQNQTQQHEYVPVDPDMQYGFVSVAAGEGLHGLFADLGVNVVVSGGQTMNPSTDDILRAIHATPAKTVFVLPNNKNIIMAAEQAIKLADRQVCVLQTRTIPQGISAMLSFDPDADFETNCANMTEAIDNVSTGQLTFAARDSDFEGHKIKNGEILALDNGKLSFTEIDLTKALVKLTKKLTKPSSSYITLIYGADVSEQQAQEMFEAVRAKISDDVEISLVNGGQPVYYYIISVE
ncbi:MAG: DAK2 domain-containing protein [Oscillospiraceae bacterium]|nr:DAK2 domain-containing protein [Oscillospiraceae bacterium]